jgi:hypothetical protein
MGVIAGSDADVWVAANPSITTSNEACTNTDSGVWKVYKTATHRYWDKRQPLTVEVSANGSSGWAAAPKPYTFAYAGGVLTFPSALTNHFVRVSGFYFNVTQLGDCYDWTLDLKATSQDTSVFQGSGWGSYTGTQVNGSGTIASFRTDDRLSKELTGVSPSASMSGVLEQAVTFDIDGGAYLYATSSLP